MEHRSGSKRWLIGLGVGAASLLVLMLAAVRMHEREVERHSQRIDLVLAVQIGTADEVRNFLDHGWDPNTRDLLSDEPPKFSWLAMFERKDHRALGRSLLELASQNNDRNRFEITKLLLDRGAKVQGSGAQDSKPLTWAARCGDDATTKLLLDHGADVNEVDIVGFTPLMGATLAADPKVVRLLLDRGARVTGSEMTRVGFGEPNPPRSIERTIRKLLAEAKAKQSTPAGKQR